MLTSCQCRHFSREHDPAHLGLVQTPVATKPGEGVFAVPIAAARIHSSRDRSLPQAVRKSCLIAVDPAISDDVAVDDDHARPQLR